MSERKLLELAAAHAADYLAALDDTHVAATATPDELRKRLAGPLPEVGLDPERVIDELVRGVEGGLLDSTGGRFYGWVIGGALPAAVAADWLTTAWDQNAAIVATSPAAAVVEETCGTWLKELLGLPSGASFGIVSGCQMAHVTALAAARHHVLAGHGIDVQRQGLAAGPQIRVLVSEFRHTTIDRALRLLGIGTDAVVEVAAEDGGPIKPDALAKALKRDSAAPTIVCLQAGELNTGAFDPFPEACEIAHVHGAWVHVDGAFGLWARASTDYRHLLEGVERADSWATDGHKWLNVPYDVGFAFVADPNPHRDSMTASASYFDPAEAGLDQMNWNPEWSRRSRAFAVYAAIRSLGRTGVDEMVARCCRHASRLTSEIASLPGAELIAQPVINQGLVRFLDTGGDHDRRTDEVIARIQARGEAWFGGTTWHGARVMRISVCSWRTTDADIDRTVASVGEALAEVAATATA